MSGEPGACSAAHFAVKTQRTGGLVVLRVAGELDALTAGRLARDIGHGLRQDTAAMIVDFSELRFLSAAGIAVVVDGARAAAQQCTTYAVVADGPATSRPLILLGLSAQINLHPTIGAALTQVSRGA